MVGITSQKESKPPLIMAHRGGDCFGPENSLQAIQTSLKQHCDIIELDIRKSKDNILYCYHGNWLKFIFPQLFFRKSFAELKKNYPTLITLQEAAGAVGDKSIIFLDIKDNSISLPELQSALSPLVKIVYLACQNLPYLAALPPLPSGWKKVCNGGIWNTTGRIEEIKQLKLDALEVFFWNYTEEHRKLLQEQQIEVALARWFLSKKKYQRWCQDTQSSWKWYEE